MLYDRFFWRKYCLKPLLCPGLVPGRLGRKGNFQKRFARPVGEFAPAPLLFFAGRRPYAASGYGSGDEFFSPEQRHYCSSGRTCFFRPPPCFCLPVHPAMEKACARHAQAFCPVAVAGLRLRSFLFGHHAACGAENIEVEVPGDVGQRLLCLDRVAGRSEIRATHRA